MTENKTKNKKNQKFFPDWIHETLDCTYNSEYEKAEKILEPFKEFCPFSCFILAELNLLRGMILESEEDRNKALEYCKKGENLAYLITYSDDSLIKYLEKILGKNFDHKDEELLLNWKVAVNIVSSFRFFFIFILK